MTPTNEGCTWVTQIVTKIAEEKQAHLGQALSCLKEVIQSILVFLVSLHWLYKKPEQPALYGSQECRHLKLVKVTDTVTYPMLLHGLFCFLVFPGTLELRIFHLPERGAHQRKRCHAAKMKISWMFWKAGPGTPQDTRQASLDVSGYHWHLLPVSNHKAWPSRNQCIPSSRKTLKNNVEIDTMST